MPKRGTGKRIVSFLKDCDDVVEIITGKRMCDLGQRVLDVYGEDIEQKLEKLCFGEEAELPADSPYLVLHCRPDADDVVVRGRYRLLVKELHPDVGVHPDPKEFQRVVEAYNAIVSQRHPPQAKPGD